MSHYRGTAEGQDKAVALAGVIVVHAALAAVILSGLSVHSVARTIETLRTFDISEPPPPPPPPPPPAAKKAHPPCPQAVDGPPGHNRGQTGDQPCGSGGDKGKGGSNDGAIIVLPLALSAVLAGGRDRAARSLRRRRSAR